MEKRLNATNYIVKRSHRAKDFIVHGDRLKEYYGEIDDSAWPHVNDGSRPPAMPGPDSTASDPIPAAGIVNSHLLYFYGSMILAGYYLCIYACNISMTKVNNVVLDTFY